MRTELLFITKYKYTQCQHVSILTLVKHTKCTSPSIITPVRISRHIQHLFMYECSHSSQFLCSCFPILEDEQKNKNLSPWLLLVFTIASPIPQCIVGWRSLRSPHSTCLIAACDWVDIPSFEPNDEQAQKKSTTPGFHFRYLPEVQK